MSKLWVIVLATLPFQIYFIWTVGWLVLNALRNRRTAHKAATEALTTVRKPRQSAHEPNTGTAQFTPANWPRRSEPSQENNR